MPDFGWNVFEKQTHIKSDHKPTNIVPCPTAASKHIPSALYESKRMIKNLSHLWPIWLLDPLVIWVKGKHKNLINYAWEHGKCTLFVDILVQEHGWVQGKCFVHGI